MTLCLGIDTSGRGGSVALADENGVLGREIHDPDRGYAEEIFGLVDRLLVTSGHRRDAIDRVAVVQGPGSFTGLRIGIMTAKTIAFARGIPLWACRTLPLLAAREGAERRLAVADAGGGAVWCSILADEGRVEESPIERLDAAAMVELHAAHGQPDVVVSGTDLRDRVAEWLQGSKVQIGLAEDLAGRIALLSARGAEPSRGVDVEALMPDYVSASQAERTHGLDLRDEIARPIEPKGWT